MVVEGYGLSSNFVGKNLYDWAVGDFKQRSSKFVKRDVWDGHGTDFDEKCQALNLLIDFLWVQVRIERKGLKISYIELFPMLELVIRLFLNEKYKTKVNVLRLERFITVLLYFADKNFSKLNKASLMRNLAKIFSERLALVHKFSDDWVFALFNSFLRKGSKFNVKQLFVWWFNEKVVGSEKSKTPLGRLLELMY